MKGKVEVFAIAADGTQTLVASEPNLVVDGAGESIVDMLTVPSATLGIAPRVMDTSNWRFGALSFGPAAGAFSANAYTYPNVDRNNVATLPKYDDLCNGNKENVTSWFNQIHEDKMLRIKWASGTIGEENGATVSSYTPPYHLPSYPDPLDRKLEDAITAYAAASGDGTECFGQFENRIQFNPDDTSSYFQGAYGSYFPDPGGGSPTGALSGTLITSYEGDFQTAPFATNYIVNESRFGVYNQKDVMDYRGFISTQYGNTNQLASQYVGRVGVSGAEANNVTKLIQNPKVTVFTTIPLQDVWSMNLYGGLHQIGLWNMDTPKALLSNEAPFLEGNYTFTIPNFINTTTGVTKQEFKLFAKKTFTNNLTQNRDNGLDAGFQNPQNLKILWTLDFRSDHD